MVSDEEEMPPQATVSPKIGMNNINLCICLRRHSSTCTELHHYTYMNTAVHMYGRPILVFRGHSYLDSYTEGSDKVRQLQAHRAGNVRRQDTAEDHRSLPQGAWGSCRMNRAVSDQTVLPPI